MDLEIINLNEGEIENQNENDGLVLKDISPYALSSDVHSPLSPPRPTQPNVGLQLVSGTAAQERWGVRKEQYGGVGPKYCADPRYSDVPRKMWHARTGLHEEVAPSMTPANRMRTVLKNKAFFASPVVENGCEVYNSWSQNHVDRRPREVHRSLFPRSIVYELEYMKNENRKKMMSALQKEREAFEEKIRRKMDRGEQERREAYHPGKSDSLQRALSTDDEPTGDQHRPCVATKKQPSDQPVNFHSSDKHQTNEKSVEIANWSKDSNIGKRCVHREVIATDLQELAADQPTKTEDFHRNVCRPVSCECHESAHRQLGRVATSTIWRPVVPREQHVAAEVTPGGCMSVTGICGTKSFKKGKPVETNIAHDESEFEFPGKEIQYTPYDDQERQEELFKCGRTLWTQGHRWMERNSDRLPPLAL